MGNTWWVLLEATAETMVAVPRRFEAGNLYESQMEIPGATVRGAFAALYLNLGNPVGDSFRELFESPSVRFGPLRPLPVRIGVPEGAPVFPVPRSSRSCKYDDGLPESGHGVLDMLLEVAKAERTKEEILCSRCGAPIEPLEKPWLISSWEDNFEKGFGIDYKPDFRLSTHVGIGAVGTAEMGVAMEGRLFSLQCFPQGTKFRGWIAFSAGNNTEDVGKFLGKLGLKQKNKNEWLLPFHLRVGRRSSTLGALQVSALVSDKPPWQLTHGKLEQRWEFFQKRFWQRLSLEELKLRGGKKEFSDCWVFSVTCLTETILLDNFLRPYRILTVEEVGKRLGISPDAIELLAVFARPQVIRGWNTAHRLPKEQDLAIAAGSVFLFCVRRGSIEECQLLRKLQEWEEQGIGWRRSEGFGQVLICDPWHLRTMLEEEIPLSHRRSLGSEDLKPGNLDEGIVCFVKNYADRLNALTNTQLERLKSRALLLESIRKANPNFNACKELEKYLRHQEERRIGGWGVLIQQNQQNQTLAGALINVLGVVECDWEKVLKRVEDFVRLMLVLKSSKDPDFNLNRWLERGEKKDASD